MICFWMWGTSSSGMRTPRSPRATMTASATSTMASRSATASGVSILATSIGTGGAIPSGPALGRFPHGHDVGRRSDERHGDGVDALADDDVDSLQVLRRRRHRVPTDRRAR